MPNLYNGTVLMETAAVTYVIVIGFAVLIDAVSLPMNLVIGLAVFLSVFNFGTGVMPDAALAQLPVRHPGIHDNFKKQLAARCPVHCELQEDRISCTEVAHLLWRLTRARPLECLLHFEFTLNRDSYITVRAGNNLLHVNSGAAVSLSESPYFEDYLGTQVGTATARTFDVPGRIDYQEEFGGNMMLHTDGVRGGSGRGTFNHSATPSPKRHLVGWVSRQKKWQENKTMTL